MFFTKKLCECYRVPLSFTVEIEKLLVSTAPSVPPPPPVLVHPTIPPPNFPPRALTNWDWNLARESQRSTLLYPPPAHPAVGFTG